MYCVCSGASKKSVELLFSIIEDSEEKFEISYKKRKFLGAWEGLLPEFFREEDKSEIRTAYLHVRPRLSEYIEKLVFVPAVRGFFSLEYGQTDHPPENIDDEFGFAHKLVNKMIFPDYVDGSKIKELSKWASSFGIEDLETILQPGPKIEARGSIMKGEAKLPVGLYGFGSTQALAMIGKCIFAPDFCPILVEEPEIHLHPELQALTADFLIRTMKDGHQVFVSTHSEHFIGRLQRRVADGTIKSDDVLILWVQLDDEFKGTMVEHVEMDEQGLFHEGLQTYLRFAEEEMTETQIARLERENEG